MEILLLIATVGTIVTSIIVIYDFVKRRQKSSHPNRHKFMATIT